MMRLKFTAKEQMGCESTAEKKTPNGEADEEDDEECDPCEKTQRRPRRERMQGDPSVDDTESQGGEEGEDSKENKAGEDCAESGHKAGEDSKENKAGEDCAESGHKAVWSRSREEAELKTALAKAAAGDEDQIAELAYADKRAVLDAQLNRSFDYPRAPKRSESSSSSKAETAKWSGSKDSGAGGEASCMIRCTKKGTVRVLKARGSVGTVFARPNKEPVPPAGRPQQSLRDSRAAAEAAAEAEARAGRLGKKYKLEERMQELEAAAEAAAEAEARAGRLGKKFPLQKRNREVIW